MKAERTSKENTSIGQEKVMIEQGKPCQEVDQLSAHQLGREKQPIWVRAGQSLGNA